MFKKRIQMKFYVKTMAVALGATILFSGCAFSNPEPPARANTLIEDLSLLKPSPLNENALYYIERDTDFSNYNNIIVNPVKVITNTADKDVNEELIKEVSTYFNTILNKDLKSVYPNNEKNLKSLQISISIVNIEATYDDLKIYQYLPYGLAFTAIKRGTGIEDRKARVSLAIKLYDAKTLKTLALLVDKEAGKDIDYDEAVTFQSVKPILDEWSRLSKVRLTELKNGKYTKILKELNK